METLFEFSPLLFGIIPLVVGLVELIKKAGMPTRFASILSLLLGLGLVALIPEIGWRMILIQGIIAGLTASGLYSGGKKVITGK